MSGEPSYLKKPIPIVYEDENCLIFNKPAGLLVTPTAANEPNTLTHIVNYQYVKEQNQPSLHPCHRLDRDTSGLIIYAKGKARQQAIMDLFQKRKIHKTYIAYVHGRLRKGSGEIKSRISDIEQRKYNKDFEGVWAITQFKVIRYFSDFTVVEVKPLTGRTNQIRIHFSEAGHPLVGERKYCYAKDFALKFKRTALHAHALAWIDPTTGKNISVKLDVPNDMEVFLERYQC